MELIYITNHPEIAQYAQECGIDRIMVDLESVGKNERQRNLDTLISRHCIDDVRKIRALLSSSKLLVRVNPIYEGSLSEIDNAISAGPDILMLPMFTTDVEVKKFVEYVGGRVKVCLLAETAQALARIDRILDTGGIDEVHIGLNDLHLSMGLDFMFELLSGGIIDYLLAKVRSRNIPCGFGGAARIGTGTLPAELIYSEHYRLGSHMVILSREFHGRSASLDELRAKLNLDAEIRKIRDYESCLKTRDKSFFEANRKEVVKIVNEIGRAFNE